MPELPITDSRSRRCCRATSRVELLAPRGLIGLDGTLWSEEVVDPDDVRSQLMHDLNEPIAGDEGVVGVQLPVRDGVNIVRLR